MSACIGQGLTFGLWIQLFKDLTLPCLTGKGLVAINAWGLYTQYLAQHKVVAIDFFVC
jgi:hypothetical protein